MTKMAISFKITIVDQYLNLLKSSNRNENLLDLVYYQMTSSEIEEANQRWKLYILGTTRVH